MRSCVRVILLLAVAWLLVSCAPNRGVIGSTANLPSREVTVADFNAVEVNNALQVQITQGDTFKVIVYADKNLIDRVHVDKVGSVLRLRRDADPVPSIAPGIAEIHITMPRLEELRLDGASRAEIKNITTRQDIAINASGASQVQGKLAAQNAKFDVSGASNVRLDGSAENMVFDVSGASRLDLHGFRVGNTQATLSGASTAQINATGKLDYHLSGASHLTYQGRPSIDVAEASGGSSVSQ